MWVTLIVVFSFFFFFHLNNKRWATASLTNKFKDVGYFVVNIYIMHTQHTHIHTYVFFFVFVADSLAMDGICFDFEIPCLFDLVPFQFKIKKKKKKIRKGNSHHIW